MNVLASVFLSAFFLCPNFCLSEWILLPPVYPKQFQNEIKIVGGNRSEQICPDFHNLTEMSYGSTFKEKADGGGEWGISMEDLGELIKENQKLPKPLEEKTEFVRSLARNLMVEAEKRMRILFSSSREARTTHLHSPSMESALMTISMLLFGVFLSKLILKLLLSHYNQYNGGMMAMMTGIRRPLTFAHKRRERSLQSQLKKIQLMDLIDKYNSQYS